MFGGSPFYRTYNPYQSPQPQFYPYHDPRSVDLDRARSLAAQRARRAQWLPDEYDDDDEYDAYRLSPHERAYLKAHQELERRRRQYSPIRPESNKRPPSPRRTTPDGRIPSPSPQRQMSPQKYDEKHAEAASILQRYFRIHQSICTIRSLASVFSTLRQEFTYPSTISFQNPSSSSSADATNVAAVIPSSIQSNSDEMESDVKIPKLAFNTTNYHLHAYTEALDKLLVKLDGIESRGDADVRARRKQVVRQIEEEQAFVERLWRASWLKHLQEQGACVDGDVLAEARSA